MAGEIIHNLLYYNIRQDFVIVRCEHAFSVEGSLLGRETHSNHVKLRLHASCAVIPIPRDSVFAFRICAAAGKMGFSHSVVRVRNAYVRMIQGATENTGVENATADRRGGKCRSKPYG